MKSKEDEYKELFLTEALDNFEELNRLFVDLEKDNTNKQAINSIFRIVHTLKGNALGMGYESIADLAHTVEDVFGAIKEGEIPLTPELSDGLFRANDKLGALINAITTEKKVAFLGIKAKLEIYLKNAREQNTSQSPPEGSHTPPSAESTSATDESEASAADEQVEEQETNITFNEVVQIPIKKMDDLLNLVGELVIERDRLISLFGSSGQSTLEFERMKRISSNLHYSIMNVRMVQMGFLFNKFHRVLRDAASTENKSVELVLKGTEVEIDRNILKIISDSMVHLVRNAVSHGIESAAERAEKGKPATASVTLSARLEKDNVAITISDDGKGIDVVKIREKIIRQNLIARDMAEKLPDKEVIRYIFEPGFSSADKVTEISGRGVGMDVVKRSVESIGGQVLVDTELGIGTSIHLLLPSSLALKAALLFEVSEQEYAIPLTYIDSIAYINSDEIHTLGNSTMVDYKSQSIPILLLKNLLENGSQSDLSLDDIPQNQELNVVIAAHSDRKIGLIVDKLHRQKEIIEKKLPKPLDTNRILSGSTILGSGKVCPVIDVASVLEQIHQSTITL